MSVGMPVWNGEAYVASALESILGQTYADFELIIGDNGSTDGTEDICRAYGRDDTRVSYHRHPTNLGAARNHNFVFERSAGEYFKWAAYDDLCGPELLSRGVDVLDADPDVVVAYPWTKVIDGTGSAIGDYHDAVPCEGTTPSERLQCLLGVPYGRSLLHWCYPIYGVMRSAVLRRTPLIAPFNGSDDVLLVELALRGRYTEVPEHLFTSRRHPGRSLERNTTQEEVAAWFDPARGKRFPAQRTRMLAGYARSIARVPMPPAERLACYGVLGGWLASERHWRIIGGEIKITARERIAGIGRDRTLRA